MRKVQIIAIALLVVGLVLLIGMGAGACGGGEEEETAPTTTPALPKPGEWAASTGCSEFTFTFTVSPDSTGIAEFYYCLTELECDGAWSSAESTVECIQIIPITGGQFAIEDFTVARPFGERWSLTVQGRFDETGMHASGAWEISAEGTICQAGTWESSRGS